MKTPPLPLLCFLLLNQANAFNLEIERRVVDAIDAFFGVPEDMALILREYRKNGGFTHDLSAPDRDAFFAIAHSLKQVSNVGMIYFGAEDGVFMGNSIDNWGTYREPGNSGYLVEDPEMQQYFSACVDAVTGASQNCTQESSAKYVQCINDCVLELCLAQNSTTEEKWCYQYEIAQLGEAERGFVPRTYHCHDVNGQFTQTPGMVLQADGSLGDCLFEDHTTLVDRQLPGNNYTYEYCRDVENDCQNVFLGGFRSVDYDPRVREWYIVAKTFQRPVWSQPYVFFSSGDLGITFSHPIYSSQSTPTTTNKTVFSGVLGVDYTFQELSYFLNISYGASSEIVAIYERAEPHYVVATSTDFRAAAKVLKNDTTQLCPVELDDGEYCKVTRHSMADMATLGHHSLDPLAHAAYKSQIEANYPNGLVSVKMSDIPGTQAYASKSSFYSAGDKNLEWTIIVISPVERSSTDAVTTDDGLFGVVCAIAGLGFILCTIMLYSFLSQRRSRAVILADWRFTSAFLTGCALTNLSSLTFLGDNTTELCLLRMWSFHLLFACTLSPLFVKVYRMFKLVGSAERHPSIISSTVAFAMTMPIILLQITILTVFTIVDPSQPEESILIEDSGATQVVECQHESPAFAITILTYEVGLVLVGCALAFAARKVDPGFGQSTELLFSMFNIAFIGLGIGVITVAMNVDQQAQIVLFAMGIFWGTVYSSAAFVVPRLLQARQDTKAKADHTQASQISNEKQRAAILTYDTDGRRPSKPFLGKDITGWSAVVHDDNIALGTRSVEDPVQSSQRMLGTEEAETDNPSSTNRRSVNDISGWSAIDIDDEDDEIALCSRSLAEKDMAHGKRSTSSIQE